MITTKSFILNILFILSISVALALVYNFFSPDGLNLFSFSHDYESVSDSLLFDSRHSQISIENVTIEQALKLYNSKSALFIDARSTADFHRSHIPNAINIPYKKFDNSIESILTFSRDTLIVTYCIGIECNSSHELAMILTQFGFKRVFIMKDGLSEWTKRGLPVISKQNEKFLTK